MIDKRPSEIFQTASCLQIYYNIAHRFQTSERLFETTQNAGNLCWLDMEMAEPDPERERIIGVTMIITDSDLNTLARSEVYVVRRSNELLDDMDAWNTTTRDCTGPTQRVHESRLTEAEVEQKLLDFIVQWIPEKATPMCGNSTHQDRRLMVKYIPRLEAYFHCHNLDASTLKEFAKRWSPPVAKGVVKRSSYQALDDILGDIKEMRHYHENFLKLPEAVRKHGTVD